MSALVSGPGPGPGPLPPVELTVTTPVPEDGEMVTLLPATILVTPPAGMLSI